jgi:hypothetical protein
MSQPRAGGWLHLTAVVASALLIVAGLTKLLMLVLLGAP